jgi:hypothetical protein
MTTPTVISGAMARSYHPAMFSDLTDATFLRSFSAGVTTLTIDVELAPEVAAAILARLTSRDDADQAARANLASLLTTDTTASPLSVALANYLLNPPLA